MLLTMRLGCKAVKVRSRNISLFCEQAGLVAKSKGIT